MNCATPCGWKDVAVVCAACRAQAAGIVPSKVMPMPKKVKARGRTERGKMNSTETAYSLHLEARKMAGEILGWWFESITLRLGPDCRFNPDFLVQLADGTLELHDTKARMKKKAKDGSTYFKPLVEDDARVKLSVTAGMFPFSVFTAFKGPDGIWVVEEIK